MPSIFNNSSILSLFDKAKKFFGDFRFLDKALIEEVKEMLENLNLNKHLNSYINNEQILSLVDSMYSPERAKNFYEEISHKEIKDIVNSSLV